MAELDQIDEQHLEELAASPGYALVCRRIERMIEEARLDLERDIPEQNTWRLRGFIAGCRRCLDVPGILMAEARKNLH